MKSTFLFRMARLSWVALLAISFGATMATTFKNIQTRAALSEFCHSIAGADVIAFDTEFVSEDCYQPQLCLIQVASGAEIAVIDALKIENLDPFWELIISGKQQTVVHAAREECRFIRQFTGSRASRLFDTQVGAGLIGLEYPAAYSTLVRILLGKSIAKSETRTNWRKRPLSDRQLEYAANDVLFLQELHRELSRKLQALGREAWMEDETQRQQIEFEKHDSDDRWRRLAGIGRLSTKDLTIIRELWRWREAQAQKRDTPARRILRDDLILELAKRGVGHLSGIRNVRGMEFGRLDKHLPEISAAIQRALDLPKSERPARQVQSRVPQLGLLGQFLATALGVLCREASVAPTLVGSTQELRELAAWRLGLLSLPQPPRLATGWRKEIIGQEIEHVLSGERTLRVENPKSDQPLIIERRNA